MEKKLSLKEAYKFVIKRREKHKKQLEEYRRKEEYRDIIEEIADKM